MVGSINLNSDICSVLYIVTVMATSKMSAAASAKRKERDIAKLKANGYEVILSDERNTYEVVFKGPSETPYESGCWKIVLYLPDEYPYKSPSVGFVNKIFHPNVDFLSGTVCLDVINQTWTPMYELVNIFEIFLPQLLTYPNPVSPLNHQAAKVYSESAEKYAIKVKECIKKYSHTDTSKQPKQSEKPIEVEKPSPEKMQDEGSDQDLKDCSQLSSISGMDKHQQLDEY